MLTDYSYMEKNYRQTFFHKEMYNQYGKCF